MKKRSYVGLAAAIGMLVLILDSKTALEGARTGIDLCLRTVIPSLFPFFLLSILLTRSLLGSSLPWLGPVGALCRMPKGAEPILISAFLGGYPVGAQAVAAAYNSGHLSKTDAQRMLGFCSNAGPAFLFGMVGTMFSNGATAWVLWLIHIVAALLTAAILPGGSRATVTLESNRTVTLPDALRSALGVMAAVSGWVVLFRVVIAVLNRWALWFLPMELRVAVVGLLELSNGCCELWKIPNEAIRFLICSGILSFGGLCVTMQTVSVTTGLSLKTYCIGKLMQTVFSLVLSIAVICRTVLPVLAVLTVAAGILRKTQKRGSIPAPVGV